MKQTQNTIGRSLQSCWNCARQFFTQASTPEDNASITNPEYREIFLLQSIFSNFLPHTDGWGNDINMNIETPQHDTARLCITIGNTYVLTLQSQGDDKYQVCSSIKTESQEGNSDEEALQAGYPQSFSSAALNLAAQICPFLSGKTRRSFSNGFVKYYDAYIKNETIRQFDITPPYVP